MNLRRILIAMVLVATFARPAAADFNSALVLGTGYARGPSQWTPWVDLPAIEDSLWIYGPVTQVNEPFTDLVPAGPHEFTYVFDSYFCVWSTWGEDLVCSLTMLAFFDFGRISIYLDTSPDADFSNPGTFYDGQLVLQADAHPLQLFMEEHCINGTRYVQRAIMTFTGGAWFDRVSKNGVGFFGGDEGEFRGDIPQGLQALGYIGQSTSVINIVVPNAVEPTTWGRIKAMYR